MRRKRAQQLLDEQHAEKTQLVKRTHEIFCGLHGKDIRLESANPPGRTDCETYIMVPWEDPDVDLVHKHEWQHIVFKTNLPARISFVNSYMHFLQPGGLVPGTFVYDVELQKFLHLFINALDDLRVCSLWGRIYPGSAEAIEARWHKLILDAKSYEQNIIVYMMGLGLNLDVPHGVLQSRWDKFRELLQEGALEVRGKGFSSCLDICRRLLEVILGEALRSYSSNPQFPVPRSENLELAERVDVVEVEPTEHLEKAKERFVESIKKSQKVNKDALKAFDDTTDLTGGITIPFPQNGRSESERLVDSVMHPSLEKVRAVKGEEASEIESIVKALTERKRKKSEYSKLTHEMESYVRVVEIHKSEVNEQVLEPGDRRIVEASRALFSNITDRRRRMMSDSGNVLNLGSYLSYLHGSEDQDVFEDEVSSKGFSAVVLLDMSGSMSEVFPLVSRACKILSRAIRSPFSSFEVWAFSQDNDSVRMFRYLDNDRGFMPRRHLVGAWGATPLYEAIRISVRRVQTMSGTNRHVLVLTDGEPTNHVKSGVVDPVSGIHDVVAKARSSKVNVAALVLGNGVADSVATEMFLHKNQWRRLSSGEELYKEMIRWVTDAFSSYLRGR